MFFSQFRSWKNEISRLFAHPEKMNYCLPLEKSFRRPQRLTLHRVKNNVKKRTWYTWNCAGKPAQQLWLDITIGVKHRRKPVGQLTPRPCVSGATFQRRWMISTYRLAWLSRYSPPQHLLGLLNSPRKASLKPVTSRVAEPLPSKICIMQVQHFLDRLHKVLLNRFFQCFPLKISVFSTDVSLHWFSGS